MSVLWDSLDYSQPVGWSDRVKECDNCVGMGNSMAVQITRKEDGFLWHCFRCKKSGYFHDTKASPADVAKLAAAAQSGNTKKADNRPEVVTLPEDMSAAIPPKALVYLYDRYVEPADIGRFQIGWSQSHMRTVFPVFKYAALHDPATKEITWAKDLVGWTGKKLDDDTSKKPKWHTVRQRDIKHPRYTAVPETWDRQKRVVLVEDVISAIRISQLGYMSIALMTTYLPYEIYSVLKAWEVRVWLDDDAYDKACKYFASLNSNGVSATVVHTKKDPKDISPDDIQNELKWG
jgi:hypothetical protein